MKKYAAYFSDSSSPLVISAQNKKEAEKKAREYRRAWKLPALDRLESITDEEAEKLTAANKTSAPETAQDTLEERPETISETETESAETAPNYAPVEFYFLDHEKKGMYKAAAFDNKERCFNFIQFLIDCMESEKAFDENIAIIDTATGAYLSPQKIRVKYGFRKRTSEEKLNDVKTWTDKPTKAPEATEAAQETPEERPETISKTEEEKKGATTMKEFTFTAETMTAKGKTYPVEYSTACNAVIVFVTVNGERNAAKLRFERNHPSYADALAAATEAAAAWKSRRNAGESEETTAEQVETVAETLEAPEAAADPVETVAETPEAPEAPEAAADPVEAAPEAPETGKALRGPVPEKTFIGQTITGNGWKILFDAETSRTRIIFNDKPSNEAKAILDAAGFFYSTGMDSWNKKLTFKAYRAAQAVSEKLAALCA